MVMKAAQEMGRKRWKGIPQEERSKFAKEISDLAHAALTPEERSERAKVAAAARWGKKKK